MFFDLPRRISAVGSVLSFSPTVNGSTGKQMVLPASMSEALRCSFRVDGPVHEPISSGPIASITALRIKASGTYWKSRAGAIFLVRRRCSRDLELNGGAMGSIDEPEGGYRVLIPGTPEFGHLDVPRRASLAFLPFDPVQGSTGCTALDE